MTKGKTIGQRTKITVNPIGFIRTPYKEKSETPRQPGAKKENVVGEIVLYPGSNFEQALENLSGFERIWILSWFDKSPNWKPKVLPPRGNRMKKGVFSTRSPHRPNPIGLSLCNLLSVERLLVRVENPDLLDGTPILDLKPYIPYADAFPESAIGWLGDADEGGAVHYEIVFSQLAIAQNDWLKENFQIDLFTKATEVLSVDPYPHPYRRVSPLPDGSFSLAVKSWRVLFRVAATLVTIENLQSGYSLTALADTTVERQPLHDEKAHTEFHQRWPQLMQ